MIMLVKLLKFKLRYFVVTGNELKELKKIKRKSLFDDYLLDARRRC